MDMAARKYKIRMESVESLTTVQRSRRLHRLQGLTPVNKGNLPHAFLPDPHLNIYLGPPEEYERTTSSAPVLIRTG